MRGAGSDAMNCGAGSDVMNCRAGSDVINQRRIGRMGKRKMEKNRRCADDAAVIRKKYNKLLKIP